MRLPSFYGPFSTVLQLLAARTAATTTDSTRLANPKSHRVMRFIPPAATLYRLGDLGDLGDLGGPLGDAQVASTRVY